MVAAKRVGGSKMKTLWRMKGASSFVLFVEMARPTKPIISTRKLC